MAQSLDVQSASFTTVPGTRQTALAADFEKQRTDVHSLLGSLMTDVDRCTDMHTMHQLALLIPRLRCLLRGTITPRVPTLCVLNQITRDAIRGKLPHDIEPDKETVAESLRVLSQYGRV